jgi:hypothetical protein
MLSHRAEQVVLGVRNWSIGSGALYSSEVSSGRIAPKKP